MLLAIGLAVAGCGETGRMAAPTSTTDDAAVDVVIGRDAVGEPSGHGRPPVGVGGFYPLAVGNRWDYLNRVTTRIVSPGSPDAISEWQHPWLVEIQRVERIGARLYHMQMEIDPNDLNHPDPLNYLFAMRQDRSGLYNRDQVSPAGGASRTESRSGPSTGLRAAVASALAGDPRRAAFERAADALEARIRAVRLSMHGGGTPPDGPGDAEISLLRYPLRPGASWVVRPSPLFSRVVEGRELLDVPAGSFPSWRLRLDSELYAPDDRVHLWYGNVGLVRMLHHSEMDATDDTGNVIGRLIWDSDQQLSAYSLVRPSRPVAFGPPGAR